MNNHKEYPGHIPITRMLASLRNIMALPGVNKGLFILAYAQPLMLAILMYIVASRFAAIGVDAHHDGIMFKPALDVAEGKMLFRDTFTQYGALTTLLQALALKIFGHYLLVIRLQTALFYALSIYFLWLIWKRFIPQWLATVGGLIYICMAPYFSAFFLPWSSVYGLFFLVLSLYFIILFIEKRAWLYMLAAGAAVALTLWCRQPVGILLFCALSFFLVGWSLFGKSTRPEFYSRAALFLAGFVIVNALFLAWLLFNHALKDMWLQSFVYAFMFEKSVSRGRTLTVLIAYFIPAYHRFCSYPSFNSFPSYVWSALPVVCLVLFFRTVTNYMWRTRLDAKQAVVFAAVMVCLASWGQYYPLLCEHHTYWSVAPMIGVFAYFVWDLLKNENALYRGVVTLVTMAVLFQADITNRITDGKLKLHNAYITLSYPKVLKGMRATPADAVFFQSIAADIDGYFRQHPEGGLLNHSRDALFPAFVENIPNFHPLHVFWPGFEVLYPDYFTKLAEYASNRRPIIISPLTNAMIYDGYTIKSLGRDIIVTAPDDTNSVWHITAFRCIMRAPGAPDNAARNYCLDMQYAPDNTATTVRAIGAVVADFNGVVKGAWHPVAQTANSITLGYVNTSSNEILKPISSEFIIPPGRTNQLWLTGHDFPHYSMARKVTITAIMNDNTRSQQIISLLSFEQTPVDLINLSVQRYSIGDFQGGVQAAEEALCLRPDSAVAHIAYNNICAACNALGEWDKAVAAGERAVALDPNSALAKRNLAWAKSRGGTKQ